MQRSRLPRSAPRRVVVNVLACQEKDQHRAESYHDLLLISKAHDDTCVVCVVLPYLVEDSGSRVSDLGFEDYGLGFRVWC